MTKRTDSTLAALQAAERVTQERAAQAAMLQKYGPEEFAVAVRTFQLIRERQRQGTAPKDDIAAARQIIGEAKHAAATRKLVDFAGRLSAQDLNRISHLHSVGGWPEVERALKAAGLDSDAIEVAGATVRQGGLEGLRSAVVGHYQAQNLAQRRVAATREAAAFGRVATAEDLERLQALNLQGGPELVAQALIHEAGMSPDAAALAFAEIRQNGVEHFLKTSVELAKHEDTHLQAAEHHRAQLEQAATAAQKTMERLAPQETDSKGTKAVKEGSPLVAILRDPAFHQAAAAWFAPRAEKLQAAGFGLRKGESPGEWMVRQAAQHDSPADIVNGNPTRLDAPRWKQEEAAEALADVVGESPEMIRAWFQQVNEARTHHQMRALVSKDLDGERARRASRVVVEPGTEAPSRAKKQDRTEEAMAKAAEAIGLKDEDQGRRVHSTLEGAVATAMGEKIRPTKSSHVAAVRIEKKQAEAKARHARSVDSAMERAHAHLTREPGEAEPSADQPEESRNGMKLDDAIKAAEAALGGTDDE